MKTFLPAAAILASAISSVALAQDSPRFTTESRLVVLHVSVKDRSGGYAAGLTADAFRVFDEGRSQPIRFFAHEDAPVTVGLVIDSSGSMQHARDRVIRASAAFVESSNPEDEVFALVFNDDVRPVLPPPIRFTSDAGVLTNAMSRVFVPMGRTALYDAIGQGLAYAAKGTRERQALVLLSDGGDNVSRTTFAEVLALTQASNAVIYTVSLADPNDPEANPKRLRQFAEASGGAAFSPESAAEVGRAFADISQDVRHGYTLAYEPTDVSQPTGYRRIRVEVRAPDGRRLVSRTRTGYLAGHTSERDSDGR